MLMEFEKKPCGRCGGSGQYSYNQIDGSRCYGCGGTGKALTKRGKAALRWLKEQQAVRADEIAPGDYIDTGFNRFVVDVVYQDRFSSGRSLQPDGTWTPHGPSIHLLPREGSKASGLVTAPVHKLRRIGRGETWRQDREAWLKRAFEYQDSLTQAGVPRKRA